LGDKRTQKYQGYQDYLIKNKKRGLKGKCENFFKKNKLLEKIFYRLTNISVKKLEKLPNIQKARKVLDIGCGTGDTLVYINKFINKNIKLFGVDLEKNKQLPNIVNFKTCNIEDEVLPFESNTFDIVISNFILEHLTKPQNLFSESFRVLKKGGFLYCTTEYFTSLFCPDSWNFYSDPTHVRPWTKRSLETLAFINNFEVYKVGTIKWWEFLPLMPVFPLLNLVSTSNFSFIPFEIIGRTVYITCKKP